MKRTDWIVVGAGSAGCMVASRLVGSCDLGSQDSGATESGRTVPDYAAAARPQTSTIDSRWGSEPRECKETVTLVEPVSTEAPAIDRVRPSRWLNLLGSDDDWNFATESDAGLANRSLNWPRGRGIGGSSRINAMIWSPPKEEDLRMLVEAFGGRWSLAKLEFCFTEVCSTVRPESPRWLSEASLRFMQAMQNRQGHPQVYERLNRQGRRWNPAALLHEGLQNRSIQIVRALADRLIWKRDRIVGVEVIQAGQRKSIFANRGVVLCAGAIATPTLLMRSGIGPKEILQEFDIEIRRDVAAVGAQLQDHLIMPVVFKTRAGGLEPIGSPHNLARWQTMGVGPIASNIAECGGVFCDQTVQLHITPTHYLTYPKVTSESFMTIGVNLTQPQSTGHVRIQSADPNAAPLITANYQSGGSDRTKMIEAVRFARSLAGETSLSEWILSEAIPGKRRSSDEALAKAIARYAQTLYHPAGTCRMGSSDACPVSGDFSFRGVERLWVVDASVLPRLTIGNPNATVMLLGLLAASALQAARV